MKKYILTLSLALLCTLWVDINAQEAEDSTKLELTKLLHHEEMNLNREVGAVDVITSEQIMHSGYPSVSAAIQGLAPGYVLGRVRGYSRGGNSDGPLVVIDGLTNRFMTSLTLEEIESIQILKDVTAKMIYGNRAANGVIVITTKRGKKGTRDISFSADYGYRMANDYPEYLGSADYMKYRNMALTNDGKEALYTEDDIAAAGTSYKYPDVDYYDMFVDDFTSYQKINAQLIGGDDKTQYFFNLGYMGENGLEKVGDKKRTDVINLRSNLDYAVNNFISVNLDIAGQVNVVDGNRMGTSSLFSELSSTKPNEYAIFISETPHIDSLGTSDIANEENLYGEMVYSGYKQDITSFAQTNIGMDFDFDQWVKGLSARAYVTFDINNYVSTGKSLTYRTLKPALTTEGNDTLIVNGVTSLKGSEQKFGDSYYRNMGGGANLTYDRIFGDHAITAVATYRVDNKTVKTDADVMTTIQDDKSMNFGLSANYAFQNKYVLEYTGSYMGSTRFHKDNRWGLFNAFGLSYVISEEAFMDNVSFIDYLKLKASFGTIGYDQSFDYLLYNNYYKYWAGSYKTGVKNATTLVGTEYLQSGNPDLTYEVSKEMNLGLTMRTLDNKLYIAAEYYTEERSGMPTEMKFDVPKMAGEPTIIDNYNAIETKGFELSAEYTEQFGDLTVSVGGNYTTFESIYTKYDEQNQFSFQNWEGLKVGDMMGYEVDGFYTSPEDIATYGAEDGVELTSSLGTVMVGDLRYKDLTDGFSEYNLDDNVINSYDRKVIGNNKPRHIYSIHLNLKYKNFSLYARGQGYGGYDRSNAYFSYYTNKGNVKYSKFAHQAAVPVFDTEGNAVSLEEGYSLPRLSSESSAHSYQTNSFFLQSVSYFKLRTIELNYHIPEKIASNFYAKGLDIYVRGDNIMTFSDQKDWDPESPYSGITGAPTFATYTVGVKLGF